MKLTPGRSLWHVLALLALAAACRSTGGASAEAVDSTEADEDVSWLFVQTGSSGSFDGETLTLHQVPAALMFSDRPDRITGHMKTSHLIKAWDEGEDSFAEDPPNAVLSTFGEHELPTLATVELFNPRLEGDTLAYTIEILDGMVPERFEEASLFIDNWHHERVGGFILGNALGHGGSGRGGYGNDPSLGFPAENPPVAHGDSSYLTYYAHKGQQEQKQQPKKTKPPAGNKKQAAAPPPKHNDAIEAKLARLKELFDKGLITQDEYTEKKGELLAKM